MAALGLESFDFIDETFAAGSTCAMAALGPLLPRIPPSVAAPNHAPSRGRFPRLEELEASLAPSASEGVAEDEPEEEADDASVATQSAAAIEASAEELPIAEVRLNKSRKI